LLGLVQTSERRTRALGRRLNEMGQPEPAAIDDDGGRQGDEDRRRHGGLDQRHAVSAASHPAALKSSGHCTITVERRLHNQKMH